MEHLDEDKYTSAYLYGDSGLFMYFGVDPKSELHEFGFGSVLDNAVHTQKDKRYIIFGSIS